MADVPAWLITAEVIVSGGENEKVTPARFAPVTASVKGLPARTAFGESVRIVGTDGNKLVPTLTKDAGAAIPPIDRRIICSPGLRLEGSRTLIWYRPAEFGVTPT